MSSFTLFFLLLVYLVTLSKTIFGGDAGDLVSAIITKGFAHPPGYSLFTLLGIVVNSLNFITISPAGRVTLISIVSTVLSLYFFIKIIKVLFKPKYYSGWILTITVGVLAFNYIIWLYAIVPEVFPLNTLLITSCFYLSILFYKSNKVFYLYILSLIIGLATSHHHTFFLVLPALMFLLWKERRKIRVTIFSLFICLLMFFTGLLPNLQLIIAYNNKAPIIWGNATSLKGIIYILLRQGYGTFTAGSFITNLPIHRFLQLKNLFLFILSDFTFLGIIAFAAAFIYYYKSTNKHLKLLLTAVLINIVSFGPFFFFYANFPLSGSFFFGTMERFLHGFYFFLAIFIYFGLWVIYDLIKKILNILIKNLFLKKFSLFVVSIFFLIYPFGQLARNIRPILALKNNNFAENLGRDVLTFTKPPSIILLSQDTVLFDTQYIYFSQPRFQKNKIIIHANKLLTDFYGPVLSSQYPQLKLGLKKGNRIEKLIEINKNRFNIYSNEKYPLPNLANYLWVPQGILYKLEKKSAISNTSTEQILDFFWKNYFNMGIEQQVINNNPIFKNLFTADILRAYSIAHQNTAYFYLEQKKLEKALGHINTSIILKPDDLDNNFLLSKYYEIAGDCLNSQMAIEKALAESTDSLYINQLKDIADNCYQKESEKNKMRQKIKSYQQNAKIKLKSF